MRIIELSVVNERRIHRKTESVISGTPPWIIGVGSFSHRFPTHRIASIASPIFWLRDQLQACFLTAILNSRLLEWRFRLTSTNNHVSTAEIAALPIPDCRTVITSPAETRAALAAEAQRTRRSCGHDRRLHRGSGLRRRAIGRAAGAVRRDPRSPRGPGRADDRHEQAKGRRDARLSGLAGAGNRRQDRRSDGPVAAPQLPRRLPKR